MAYSLRDLAALLNGRLVGDGDALIDHVSLPDSPSDGGVVVIINRALLDVVPEGFPLVTADSWFPSGRNGVAVSDARMAMASLLSVFRREPEIRWGVDPSASVHPSAEIAEDSYVGPLCVLSKGSVVRSGAILRANVFLGEGVSVGRSSVLEPGVVLYSGVSLGDRVIVHGNSVLGADGFGHIPASAGRGVVKVPQIGGVTIQDDVEIGACSSIDRGTIGNTVIGSGTKIDNHVQIGHNVLVGKDCLLVAQVGLAGSSVLENRVIMAARSGVQEHITVGEGATVAAMGGATKNIPPGAVVSGFPARDHRSVMRMEGMLHRLADLFDRVKKLERRCSPRS